MERLGFDAVVTDSTNSVDALTDRQRSGAVDEKWKQKCTKRDKNRDKGGDKERDTDENEEKDSDGGYG